MSKQEKYWTWVYEMRDLGSFPDMQTYKGHNTPIEIYDAKPVDAMLTKALKLARMIVEKCALFDSPMHESAIEWNSMVEAAQRFIEEYGPEASKPKHKDYGVYSPEVERKLSEGGA